LVVHTEDLADGSHIYEAAPLTSNPTTRRDAHKELVHLSPAYADTLQDREEWWRLLYEELTQAGNHDPDDPLG
jgi:hypothetical protein